MNTKLRRLFARLRVLHWPAAVRACSCADPPLKQVRLITTYPPARVDIRAASSDRAREIWRQTVLSKQAGSTGSIGSICGAPAADGGSFV